MVWIKSFCVFSANIQVPEAQDHQTLILMLTGMKPKPNPRAKNQRIRIDIFLVSELNVNEWII